MPGKSTRPRTDFKLEIRNGKLTLQTRFKTIWKTWVLTCALVIVVLIALAVLRPEGWLDILRAILLILEPTLMIAFGRHYNLK